MIRGMGVLADGMRHLPCKPGLDLMLMRKVQGARSNGLCH